MTLGIVSIVCGAVWSVTLQKSHDVLLVTFLDVGQGDSIFIESPTGRQVLIDGGPSRRVLRELGEVMPFYDRSIDMVLATHPDADHISGLVDVLARYEVDMVIQSGVAHASPVVDAFTRAIETEQKQGARTLLARRGQVLDLGGGAYLRILFPDRDVTNMESNSASIVARLTYGDTSVLLTGDTPQSIERYVVSLDGAELQSDILKLGHHGSKTSTSELLLGYANPQWAIISAGEDNRYGHPHKEVIDRLARFNIATKNTANDDSVILSSDGKVWTFRQ